MMIVITKQVIYHRNQCRDRPHLQLRRQRRRRQQQYYNIRDHAWRVHAQHNIITISRVYYERHARSV